MDWNSHYDSWFIVDSFNNSLIIVPVESPLIIVPVETMGPFWPEDSLFQAVGGGGL